MLVASITLHRRSLLSALSGSRHCLVFPPAPHDKVMAHGLTGMAEACLWLVGIGFAPRAQIVGWQQGLDFEMIDGLQITVTVHSIHSPSPPVRSVASVHPWRIARLRALNSFVIVTPALRTTAIECTVTVIPKAVLSSLRCYCRMDARVVRSQERPTRRQPCERHDQSGWN